MSALAPTARRSPSSAPLPTLYRLELRRLVRNRRTLVFSIVMPVALFFLFGSNAGMRETRAGDGNVTGYIMVSMALYGAILATTAGGATVSIERSLGWTRHLRLTPLSPLAYVVLKLALAMTVGGTSIVVAYAAGVVGGAQLPAHAWVETALLAWACSVVFAAFGLFMGYLLPSENVMQVLGPALAILSFAGGLFVPLDQLGDTFATLAKFTPTYGVGVLTRSPLTDEGSEWLAALNVLAWLTVFTLGAIWRFRKDTARV